MIIKRIKPGGNGGLKKLLDYITQPEKNGNEKCTEADGIGDFLCDDLETNKAEMIALTVNNPRSENPVEHIVISWRPGEQPTSNQIKQAVEILADEMNCQGHQIIYGVHKDKDHIHVHTAINRATDEGITPAGWIIEKQQRAIARIVDVQGWIPTKNQMYKVENGEVIRSNNRNYNKPKISQGASRAEESNGIKSAERISQEVIPQAIKQANTWRQFHEILSREGMEYRTKGSGAVIRILTNDKDTFVKASTATREASLSNLVKKFGTFEPCHLPSITPRQIEPVRGADPLKVMEYITRKTETANSIKQQRTEYKIKHNEEWQELKLQQKNERAEAINRQEWTNKGHLLNVLRSAIAEVQKQDRQELKIRQQQESQQLTATFPTFADYLTRQEGDQFRYRDRDNENNQDEERELIQKKQYQEQEQQRTYHLPSPERENDFLSLLYQRHFANIQDYIKQQNKNFNENVIDKMIAERLRMTGLEKEQIQRAIELNSQRGNEKDYARRIIETAYNPQATRQMIRIPQTQRAEWQGITKQATGELFKATAQIAVKSFTEMLKPVRQDMQQAQDKQDEEETNKYQEQDNYYYR